jgi:hypothetical protein
LRSYPNLWCERYGITDGNGQLSADWQRLFEKYPERFLIGSDTWIDERWDSYGSITTAPGCDNCRPRWPNRSPFATASDCFADHGGALSAFAMAAAADP